MRKVTQRPELELLIDEAKKVAFEFNANLASFKDRLVKAIAESAFEYDEASVNAVAIHVVRFDDGEYMRPERAYQVVFAMQRVVDNNTGTSYNFPEQVLTELKTMAMPTKTTGDRTDGSFH